MLLGYSLDSSDLIFSLQVKTGSSFPLLKGPEHEVAHSSLPLVCEYLSSHLLCALTALRLDTEVYHNTYFFPI